MDRHSTAPYPLRMQPDLRGALEQMARNNDRSLHMEILRRLKDSLPQAIATSKEAQ